MDELHIRHVVFGKRIPFSEQAAPVVACGNLQTTVIYSGFIYSHHYIDVVAPVFFPSRLRVLVGLEAIRPGHLEINLFLEQDGPFPGQLADGSFAYCASFLKPS